ncbi:MAG: YvcK family protein [Vulcanimicrobiota bacterium]
MPHRRAIFERRSGRPVLTPTARREVVLRKWLSPGMGVKRWFGLSLVGICLFICGILILVDVPSELWTSLRSRFSVRTTLGVGATTAGVMVIVLGVVRGFMTMYRAVAPNPGRKLVDVLYERKQLESGLKIAVMGGGTGLSCLLRGLKPITSNLVAVVTVCDDGGSSGRLSKDLGMLPPGDIRNCLVALADDESLLGELFNYRFQDGQGLSGHSFGNLFLAALTDVVGDFEEAIQVSSQVLASRGKVLPTTLDTVTLCARLKDGRTVRGESSIPEARGVIDQVFLEPATSKPTSEVLASLRTADAVVLGPGSLFTSIIPNLLVGGVEEALRQLHVPRIYICNVMTQPGETDGFGAADHLEALERHIGAGVVDTIVVNITPPSEELLKKYEAQGATPVDPQLDRLEKMGVKVVGADLLSEFDLVRHDSKRLATAIVDLLARHQSRSRDTRTRHLRVVNQ